MPYFNSEIDYNSVTDGAARLAANLDNVIDLIAYKYDRFFLKKINNLLEAC